MIRYHAKYFAMIMVIIFLMKNLLIRSNGQINNNHCKCEDTLCITVDCSKQELKKIPSDLDYKLRRLDISHNSITVVRKADFQNCVNLLTLNFTDNGVTPEFEPDAFIYLDKLQFLNLTNVDLSNAAIMYPRNISVLSIFNTKSNENNTNLSKLDLLRWLNLGSNLFTILPKMHKFAPLNRLELQKNPLKKFSAKQIARYCLLNSLKVDSTTEVFRHHRCECIRLREWFKFINSENTIEDTSGKQFKCMTAKPCREILITMRMLELRKNCMLMSKVELEDDYDPNSEDVDDETTAKNEIVRKIFITLTLVIFLSIVIVSTYFYVFTSMKTDQIADNPVESNDDEIAEEFVEDWDENDGSWSS